ncbi:MAG: hypothetical protein ACI906_000956 [Candidatus Latescibacterota bacterium]|jgi:hypothetical protein
MRAYGRFPSKTPTETTLRAGAIATTVSTQNRYGWCTAFTPDTNHEAIADKYAAYGDLY